MKIAIDAHCIGKNLAGNGTYTLNLVENLLLLYPEHQWIIYISPQGESYFKNNLPRNSKLQILKSKTAVERYLIEMPRLLNRDMPDMFHLQYYGPFFSHCPLVTTLHDISFEAFPQFFTFSERLRMKLLIPYFINRSFRIITVSNFSKDEIIKRYKAAESKVESILNGVNKNFFFPDEIPEDVYKLKAINVKRPFFLFVGSLQPRKNIEGLLAAYAKIYHLLPKVQFVIVGPKGWLSSGIGKTLKTYPEINSIVHFTGHVPLETLRALYRLCMALVYIPFYEGFGLPVLEAMACGAPVITSNVSSLPEVSADASLLIDPYNINEISDAIKRVFFSEKLRKELSKKGIKRVKTFSWQKTAEQTFYVFEQAVKCNSGNIL